MSSTKADTSANDIPIGESDNAVPVSEEVETITTEEVTNEHPETEAPDKNAVEKTTAHPSKSLKSEEDKEVTPPLPARKKTNEIPEPPKTPLENPILTQLKEAFPNVDEKYVKAVIIASCGALDPAFNALLFLSDPESGADIELPTQPLQQKAPELPLRRKQTQVEQDELLARQLDEEFNKNRHQHRERNPARQISAQEREARRQRIRERHRRNQQPLSPQEERELYGDDEDSWAQFMEKELPELKEKANRSIQETATKLNGWLSGFRKNIVGEYPEQSERQNEFYDDESYGQKSGDNLQNYAPKKPERRRFNSFGAQAGEESLETHGITLQNDDIGSELDEEDDVPPQIKSEKGNTVHGTPKESKIVAQTTYIDTPDASTRKKWQPVPPEPLNATPTKVAASSEKAKGNRNADDDEFLINSEDEM